MPTQPTWFPRLTTILANLRELEKAPYIDRQAFERIFGLRDRRARDRHILAVSTASDLHNLFPTAM